jgi:hypothetical protein
MGYFFPSRKKVISTLRALESLERVSVVGAFRPFSISQIIPVETPDKLDSSLMEKPLDVLRVWRLLPMERVRREPRTCEAVLGRPL